MVQYNATKLMSYNSDGTFAGDIPLARQMPKGAVRVDTKRQRITAVSICFDGSKSRDEVWEQDFDGNLLSSVSMPWLEMPMDFSNELYSDIGSRAEGFSYAMFRIDAAADSLYEYDGRTLRPVFTAGIKEGLMHKYDRLGSMYLFLSFESRRPSTTTVTSFRRRLRCLSIRSACAERIAILWSTASAKCAGTAVGHSPKAPVIL